MATSSKARVLFQPCSHASRGKRETTKKGTGEPKKGSLLPSPFKESNFLHFVHPVILLYDPSVLSIQPCHEVNLSQLRVDDLQKRATAFLAQTDVALEVRSSVDVGSAEDVPLHSKWDKSEREKIIERKSKNQHGDHHFFYLACFISTGSRTGKNDSPFSIERVISVPDEQLRIRNGSLIVKARRRATLLTPYEFPRPSITAADCAVSCFGKRNAALTQSVLVSRQ